MNFTIVTAYFDIYNMCGGYRKKEHYLKDANFLTLKLPYNMVIYIEDDDLEKEIMSIRDKKNTKIIKEKFTDTYYYKYIDILHDIKRNKGGLHYPQYLIALYNKLYFLEKSIENNYFSSTHFIWIDFGIGKYLYIDNELTLFQYSENISKNMNDKIKQMLIIPKNEKYTFINSFAGGIISGNIENILNYSKIFKIEVENNINNEKYLTDEQITKNIYNNEEYKKDFNIYYGYGFGDIFKNY